MSDTPRTDAIAHRGYHLDALAARAIDLCRELERENAALLKALKQIAAYGPDDGCCGYGCDTPSIAIAAIDAARKEAQP